LHLPHRRPLLHLGLPNAPGSPIGFDLVPQVIKPGLQHGSNFANPPGFTPCTTLSGGLAGLT